MSEAEAVTAKRDLDDAMNGVIDDLFPRLSNEKRDEIRAELWRVTEDMMLRERCERLRRNIRSRYNPKQSTGFSERQEQLHPGDLADDLHV